MPPLFSTFTLFTELLVTVFVLFIFYKGYRFNIFHKKIAIFTLSYEILFNISYMSYRAFTHDKIVGEHTHTPLHTGIAIFHGVFSLTMFILLIIFLLTAMIKYGKGVNYFREHKTITFAFIFLWMIAILSGVLFYGFAYFTNT